MDCTRPIGHEFEMAGLYRCKISTTELKFRYRKNIIIQCIAKIMAMNK